MKMYKKVILFLNIICFAVVADCFADSADTRSMADEAQKIMPAVGPKGPGLPPTYGAEFGDLDNGKTPNQDISGLPTDKYNLQIWLKNNPLISYGLKWETDRKVLTLQYSLDTGTWRYEYEVRTGNITVWDTGAPPVTYSLPYCGEKNYNEKKQCLTSIVDEVQGALDSGNAIILNGETPEQAQRDIDDSTIVLETPPMNPPILTPGEYEVRVHGMHAIRIKETADIFRVEDSSGSYEFDRKTGYITYHGQGHFVAKPHNKKLYKNVARMMKYLFNLAAKTADASQYAAVTDDIQRMNSLLIKEVNRFIRRK